MKTKVVHINKEPYDIYIGRPSKWGNPYSHLDGTLAEFKVNNRQDAIAKYEEYLLNSPNLMNSLSELKGKTLGCWCGNFTIEDNQHMKCHGQVLLELLYTKQLF